MKLNLKNGLLLGTALVAVSFAATHEASANAETLAGNVTWAVDADQNGSPADGTGAATGDAVDLSTNTLTILNTTADDGSGVGTYVLGAVTGTTGNVTVTSDAATVDLTVTIGSMVTTGTGDLTVNTLDADDSTVAVTVTGVSTIGGALSVVSAEADAADTVTLTLTGDATVAGITTLTAGGAVAGANATLNVDGAANVFTGAVTVDGGGNAAADAYITLSGASTTFTGGLALDDNTGQAILTIDGAAAQTVVGAITGVTDGDGAILVTNTVGGVTFTGTVGTAANSLASVTIAAADTNNTSATFQAGVDVGAIVLGNGTGTDTNTVTFDGSTAGFTVVGTINGTAGDTDNMVVSGGNTILTTGVIGGGTTIDALTVSGTDTILDANAAITSTTVTVGTGATLDAVAVVTASGGIANSGTLLLSGAVTHVANITGTGLLDVNAAAEITGAVTQGTADIAAVNLTLTDGTDDYTVGTTTFSAAGTLTVGNGSRTITGNFTNTTDGQGTIAIGDGAGTTTIVGDLGASADNSLAALTMETAATAQTVTTTGNLFVDAISLDSDDTLQFLGTSAQTVSGTIQGIANDEGIITVGNGTTTSDVTFNGIIGAAGANDVASMTVSAAAKARFEANAIIGGTYTNTGSTYVGDGVVLEADTITNTGTINLEVKDSGTLGTLENGDIGRIADTSGTLTAGNLHFNVTGDVATGVLQIGNGNGVGVATVGTVTDNSYQYSFAVAGSTVTATDDLDVTITRKTIASMSSTSGNNGAGTALDTLQNSTNVQIAAAVDNVAAAGSQAAVNEVLESVAPTVDAGAVVAGLNVSTQAIGVVSDRMAALRDGSAETGMVAGEMGQGLKAWGQVFGKTANMDERDGIDGYDADTIGFAVGMDTSNISDNAVIGLAFSYGDTDVESENVTKTDTNIDSYQLTVYGDVDLDERTYVSGYASYAWNNIDQTRTNVGGTSGLTANSDTDSNQFGIGAEVGRDYQTSHGFVVTPSVSANYAHVSTDGYTETGAGGLNLNVDTENFNVLDLGLAVKASWLHEQADGSVLKPSLRLGYTYDVIADEVETSSNFTGATGTSFKSKGADAERSEFNVGAGVTYFSTDNWEFTANYDFDISSDYDAHSGYLKAAYKF